MSLKVVFKSIQPESCPTAYNFHMHTMHSDGQLRPEALLQQALNHGLKGLAITDHHTIKGYRAAQTWLAHWNRQVKAPQNSPQIWSGVEITSQLLGTDVHILGYDFDPEADVLQPYLTGVAPQGDAAAAARVIPAIQAAGGLAVLAHPARYRRSPAELIPAAAELGINGIETYYAYGNSEPWQPSQPQTEQVMALGERYGLLNTCGTDTHGLNILSRI